MVNVDIRELNERIERESSFVELINSEMSNVIVGQKQMVEKLGKDCLPVKGTAAADLLITVTCSTIGNTFVKTNTYTVTETRQEIAKDEDGNPIVSENGEYLIEIVEEEVEKTDAVAYFTIVIGVRSVDQLAEVAGLVDKYDRAYEEATQTN